MKKEITWTTGTGQSAKVTVSLTLQKEIDCDGDKTTVSCCEMDIIAEVDGNVVGYGRPESCNHPIAVGKIGKLGIIAANLTKITAAITEIEKTPEWTAKMNRQAITRKAEKEYEVSYTRIRRAMAE